MSRCIVSTTTCQLAIDSVYRTLHEELVVGTFASAIHSLSERGEKLVWCNQCFPADSEGVRLGWDYLEAVSGMTQAELLTTCMDTEEILEGLS